MISKMSYPTDIVGSVGSHCGVCRESTHYSPDTHLRLEFRHGRVDILGAVRSWHDPLCVRDSGL